MFREWNQGDLDSFLVEITAEVLDQVDAQTGAALVERILDRAEQKGTGRWTVQIALELGVPVPVHRRGGLRAVRLGRHSPSARRAGRC